MFTQECFFSTDYRQVDRQKNQDQPGTDPQVSRADGKANRQNQRAQVEWVASIGVWPRCSELLIFLYVTGRQRTNRESGNDESRADQHGCCGGCCEPQIYCGENKAQRYADAPCDLRPTSASHGHSPATFVRQQPPRRP